MVGWNYPKKGNLQDIIEELHLHPSTCLTTLSGTHKRGLLTNGVVLCKDILNNPKVLSQIGMKEAEAAKVFEEARQVCGIQ